MTVFVLSNISDKTRGTLSRYMYEPHPYVFSSVLSKRQREELINYILENNKEADLLVIYEYCGQSAFETYGNPKRNVVMFEGIPLIAQKKEKRSLIDYVYAKPDKLLIDHALESGWVAYELLMKGIYRGQAQKTAEDIGTPFENLVNCVCFLAAVHDIGKAHPLFQSENMYNEGMDYLIREGMIVPDPLTKGKKVRHELYSGVIVRDYMEFMLADLFDGNKMLLKAEAKKYGDLVSYHHQGKSGENRHLVTGYKNEGKWKELIISPMLDLIYGEFPFTPFKTAPHTDRFFHFVLGATMLCDRISSANNLAEESAEEKTET